MLPLWWKSLLLCWLNCWRKEKLQQCLVSSRCLSWCFVPWRLSINNRRDGRRLETGQKEESWSKYSPCFSSTITFVSSHSNWICHVISIAETNVFLLTLTAVAGDRSLWFPFGIWGLHGHLCFLTVTWGSFPCWVLQLVLFVASVPSWWDSLVSSRRKTQLWKGTEIGFCASLSWFVRGLERDFWQLHPEPEFFVVADL